MTQTRDPWDIVVGAFHDNWDCEMSADEVVDIAFTALEEEGAETPRDPDARERAVSMVQAVFSDIGDEEGGCDYGAVATYLLRGAATHVEASDAR